MSTHYLPSGEGRGEGMLREPTFRTPKAEKKRETQLARMNRKTSALTPTLSRGERETHA